MSENETPCIESKVKCGDWIYPSSQSTTSVQYSIDFPLVLELLIQKTEGERKLSDRGDIGHHFNGSRYLQVKITKDSLEIVFMGNEHEEDYKKEINWSCTFDVSTLDRLSDIGVYDAEKFEDKFEGISGSSDKLAILFAGILLQLHSKKGKKAKFPTGICFRKATIPEIESLGRW